MEEYPFLRPQTCLNFTKLPKTMAKVARKIKTKKGLRLKIVNPDAAGIDVSDGEMQVCVPEDRDGENNRRFGSFTCDLHEICAWLKACRITTVAMEATGVYWLNIFLILQDEGFDVVLANPLQVKNMMEEKTDEADAEWLMLLHSYGMVKPSFQPDSVARRIRNLTRHRSTLITAAGREVQHMQKAMELMNIKLSTVISDVLGKSGQAIIRAIIDGNHDPKSLAQKADGRCKASKEAIAKSLEGTWDEDLLFILKQTVELYDTYQEKVKSCEQEIEKLMMRYAGQVDLGKAEKLLRSNKRSTYKNAPDIDIEKYGYALWGVNLMAVPGVGAGALLQLIAELGYDFVSKFDTCLKFCKWCNLSPNNKITGGKLISSHIPRRKNPVGQILRQCANTVKDEKSEMGAYFRRMKSKDGYMQAIVATAHKIARIIYTMVKTKKEYNPKLVGCNEKELLERKIARTTRQLQKLNEKLEKVA